MLVDPYDPGVINSISCWILVYQNFEYKKKPPTLPIPGIQDYSITPGPSFI